MANIDELTRRAQNAVYTATEKVQEAAWAAGEKAKSLTGVDAGRMMDYAGEKAGALAGYAGEKAGALRGAAAAGVELLAEKRALDKNCQTLGEWYAAVCGENPPEAVADLVRAIHASQSKIARLRDAQ